VPKRIALRLRCFTALAASMTLLLTSVSAPARGKQQHEVRDAHFGEVLYYFYQEKYFSAITRLLAAQARQQLPRHLDEAQLLLGGLYLSYGVHREAGRIFQQLIDEHASPNTRDRAWFYLAKVWYQRGYIDDAASALERVQAALPAELQGEYQLLAALVLMKQRRYGEAVAVLKRVKSNSPWANYARYNMGVALIAAGEDYDGIRLLEQVGRLRARDREMQGLKDKANLALGYTFLRAQGPERAVTYLQDVRLNGPFSNKALLGLGWARVARDQYKQALVPWMELQERNPIDVAVQESLLAVPYALRKLQANQQSLQGYQTAISIYQAETARLGQTIEAIQGGKLLIGDLLQDPGSETGWFWHARRLSDTPENRYLLQLLASHRFHEALKNYRDLLFLARNLRTWSANMDAFDAMLETRRTAYMQRLPVIAQSYRDLNATELLQERDRYAQELQRIERKGDTMALANANEQRALARLQRVKRTIDQLPATQDLSSQQRRYVLFSGLLRWQISTEYPQRLWQAKKSMHELDKAIEQARLQQQSLEQAQQVARAGFEGYAQRIATERRRLAQLRREIDDSVRAHERYLQELVINELEQQRKRLRSYVIQARFGIAQIYDHSISRVEAGK
jgi:hypothetical protein